jgi:uncharacterized protein (DUF1015 family)
MPRIEPFQALRFASPAGGSTARCLAPPYDVLDAAERRALAEDPCNIVHVDLPESPAGGDRYQAAAALLNRWIDTGVLVRDRTPSYYVLEQRFRDPQGAERTRRGFFARLFLEPLEGGSVLPHERTLESPRRDREALLAATRTHLSAVFMLHPDPGGVVAAALREVAAAPPAVAAADPCGGDLRLWCVPRAPTIDLLTRRLAAGWALIADGHHRYESALAYQTSRREAGQEDAATILVYLCGDSDPGLRIAPIHRLVRGVSGFDAARFRDELAPWFDLQPMARGSLAPALAAEAGRPGVFGFLFPGSSEGFLGRWRDGAGLDRPVFASVPEALRRLDVILLHRLVLEDLLGIGAEAQRRQQNIEYVKNAALLERGVASADFGVLLNPTRLDQVVEVSRMGLRLPQKSTFFHPKVTSGLVLDRLEDGPPSPAG